MECLACCLMNGTVLMSMESQLQKLQGCFDVYGKQQLLTPAMSKHSW